MAEQDAVCGPVETELQLVGEDFAEARKGAGQPHVDDPAPRLCRRASPRR